MIGFINHVVLSRHEHFIVAMIEYSLLKVPFAIAFMARLHLIYDYRTKTWDTKAQEPLGALGALLAIAFQDNRIGSPYYRHELPPPLWFTKSQSRYYMISVFYWGAPDSQCGRRLTM